MNKSILIGGVSRSGKSTLVTHLRQAQPHLTYVCGDALVTTFENIFPKLGIKHVEDHDKICRAFDGFLFDYLENLVYEKAAPYIVDTYHMMPEQIARRDLQQTHHVVFLGYPTYDPRKKFSEIRAHDPDTSWTKEVSDDVLMECVAGYIDVSRKMQAECQQTGIPFIDMGAQPFEQGLRKALEALNAKA